MPRSTPGRDRRTLVPALERPSATHWVRQRSHNSLFCLAVHHLRAIVSIKHFDVTKDAADMYVQGAESA